MIVAIMALLLFAAAAYAIDLGNLWQTRRNMVTASDAAALGAAGKFALGNDGCANDAPTLLTANRPDAELDLCAPSTTDTRDGYVTVKGHTTAEFGFAGLFGMQNHVVSSTTTARWGIASGAVGLRPIALCITATPELGQWLNLPNGPTGPTTTPITINLSNSQPDPCKDSGGNVAGNWGLAIGEGNNANSDTVTWLNEGYPTQVNVGDDIHANPGAFSGSVQNALQTLAEQRDVVPAPRFRPGRWCGERQQRVVPHRLVRLGAAGRVPSLRRAVPTLHHHQPRPRRAAGHLLLVRPRYRNACRAHLRRRHAQPRHH